MQSFSERRTNPRSGRRGPMAMVAAALLLLTGCQSSPFASFGFGSPDASAENGAQGDGDPSASAAASPEEGQLVETLSASAMDESAAAPQPEAAAPAPAEAPAVAAVAAVPAEPAINDDPQQLIGMGPASLSAFLGAPELIRREAPASLWQYRAEGCVLDIVLYPERGGDKVTYLEAREGGLTDMPPRQCLNKLLRARSDEPAG